MREHRPASHRTLAGVVFVCAGLFGVAGPALAPDVHADAVAYLIGVTARPGYNFANADAALSYGHSLCDKVAAGRGYRQLVDDVKADFATTDEYQASYLISQAINELCPTQIWQLRNSAAHYRPPPEAT